MDETDLAQVYQQLAEAVEIDRSELRRVVSDLEIAWTPTARGRRSRWKVAALGSALVAASVAGIAGVRLMSGESLRETDPGTATTTDSASSATGSPSWPTIDTFRYSKHLFQVANADDAFVQAGSADRGTRITLYGAGASPPAAVQEVIDQAPPGVDVTWVEVPYTRSELLRTMRTAEKQLPDVTSATFVHMTYVDIGVWPAGPERIAKLQKMADQLNTPAPIRVISYEPRIDGGIK